MIRLAAVLETSFLWIWDYNTACSYAAGLGWIDESTAHANTIRRP